MIETDDAKSDINVTPLIDVVLVLLIIFMVITPELIQRGRPVALPVAKHPKQLADAPDQLVISVTEQSQIYIEKDLIPKNALLSYMSELHDRNPSKQVLLQGDRRLRYRNIKQTMDVIGEAGFVNIALAVQRKHKAEGVRRSVRVY